MNVGIMADVEVLCMADSCGVVGTGGKFSASADCPDFDGGMMGNNPI